MKIKLLLILFIGFLISGCALFKGKGTLTHLTIEYNPNAKINYGHNFPIKVIANYSNGKTKNITSKKETTLNISGAKIKNGKVYLESLPNKFTENIISIDATYLFEDKSIKGNIEIPFNYKGDVILYNSGSKGENGAKGKDGGSRVLLKDGKAGESGIKGSDGGKGHDLSIYVWKTNDLYYIKIIDLTIDKRYYYKSISSGGLFNINCNGGNGGIGGNGGDGGNGKNGKKTEKKTKLPGDGGNGGNGASGGNGGQGGSISIFIHTNAKEFSSKLFISNTAGQGGAAGKSGTGGKGGIPLEGQTGGMSGNKGTDGVQGLQGINGESINIEILDFDIEDVKNN